MRERDVLKQSTSAALPIVTLPHAAETSTVTVRIEEEGDDDEKHREREMGLDGYTTGRTLKLEIFRSFYLNLMKISTRVLLSFCFFLDLNFINSSFL